MFDAEDLASRLGDTLVWYDIARDEAGVIALCEKLVLELQKAGAYESMTPEDIAARDAMRERRKEFGWNPLRSDEVKSLQVGMTVKAKHFTGKWYKCVLNKINQATKTVVVSYPDGTTDLVAYRRIKVPGPKTKIDEEDEWEEEANGDEEESGLEQGADAAGNPEDPESATATEATELLPQPVRISNFGIEVQDDSNDVMSEKAVREKVAASAREAMSKREIREQQKEKRRIELARQREVKRREREQQLREEALKTYLSNTNSGKSRAIDIHINNFSLNSPDGSKELLHNVTVSLNQGRVYGLIGANGVGKTTFLRAIANYEVPGFPTHIRVLHVEQEARGDHRTALETVLQADIEREVLIQEEKRLKKLIAQKEGTVEPDDTKTDLTPEEAEAQAREEQRWKELHEALSKQRGAIDPEVALEQIHARMEQIDAWGAVARAASVLHGLQFSTERMNMPTKSLSGGWRMRVALACALFAAPDLLLLDEPTNHLDFPAVLWLENYLHSYNKTVVVISHDRVFLNNVISDVLHLHHKTITTYRGDYTTFEKVRAQQLLEQKRQFEALQAQKAHMQEFIDKFRCSTRASMVQSRIKALKRLEEKEVELEEDDSSSFSMEFPHPGDDFPQSVIETREVSFSYNGKPPYIITKITCSVDMRSRIGILGANGAGKSTLLSLLLQRLEPTEGIVHTNTSARIASFAQHHMDKLKENLSPLEMMLELFPSTHPQIVRRQLGKFGITGQLQTQLISSLSGGQKSRVAFAIMTWTRPHTVLMDEPTNHLDLETVDALIDAIKNYKGGVVVVSHDQHFLQSVCTEFWCVADGQVQRFIEFADAKKFAYAKVAKV